MNVSSCSFKAGGNSTFDSISKLPSQAPYTGETHAAGAVKVDTGEIKNKKGIVQKTKDTLRSIKKFFVTAGGYTGATFRGTKNAFIAGACTFTGASLINVAKQPFKLKTLKKQALKDGSKYIKEEALKNIKKLPVKTLGVLAFAATLGATFWKTSLDVNQKRSEIDLRWKNTPIKD